MTTPPATATTGLPARTAPTGLKERIVGVGLDLSERLGAVVAAVPEATLGPQALAQRLGVDKVLTSRLLKAGRTSDPLAYLHRIPGPDPLRRLLRAAGRLDGVDASAVRDALEAVERFERLVRHHLGDRSGLDAVISAWLPEARREFELRRKQAGFKAMSQLKGAMAATSLATVVLHPSDDGAHIDILWLFGLLGLQRLRPDVTVKFTTRRQTQEPSPRAPTTLDGRPVQGVDDTRLDEFCDAPPAQVAVERIDDVVHYTLSGDGLGPHAETDLVMAEVNLREMPRHVPAGSGRKGHVFAEVGTPAKMLLFDVLVHESIYPHAEPELLIYDTALDGVADVNDRRRDIDRLDLLEAIQPLGRGTGALRLARVPRYVDMLTHALASLGWREDELRVYRCAIHYPVYGSQVVMAFNPPPPPR